MAVMSYIMILVFILLGKVLERYNRAHWKPVLSAGLLFWTVKLAQAGFFWAAFVFLSFPPEVQSILAFIVPIPFIICLLFWSNAFFDTLIKLRKSDYEEKQESDTTSVAGFNELMRILKYFAFLVVVFVAVVIFGGDVASFLNNAKLLGLIIVFSFQPWLKNLVGGITVFFDDKFALGDEVRFSNDVQGVVVDITWVVFN
jgi:small-conductance mechanosensitive channel